MFTGIIGKLGTQTHPGALPFRVAKLHPITSDKFAVKASPVRPAKSSIMFTGIIKELGTQTLPDALPFSVAKLHPIGSDKFAVKASLVRPAKS